MTVHCVLTSIENIPRSHFRWCSSVGVAKKTHMYNHSKLVYEYSVVIGEFPFKVEE